MALTGREADGLELGSLRLRIVPLTPESFGLWLENPALQAQALGLAGPGGAWDASTRAAMRQLCAQGQAHPGDYPWYASWQLVSRTERKPVGSLCFMGPPDAAGRVEIGYGTDAPYQGRGYMTEAVGTVCAWALRQPGVSAVRAGTESGNPASQAVLKHNGFQPDGVRAFSYGQVLYWRLDRGR